MKFSWQMLSLLACGSMMFGCSESTNSTVADSSGGQSASSASTDSGSSAAPEKAPAKVDPILEGLVEDFEDLPGEFAEIKTAYDKDPTNSEAVGNYVGTVWNLGSMQTQRGRAEVANEAFLRAGEILGRALDAGVQLEAADLAPLVFYNQACALSKQAKAKEALAALNRAVEGGFKDLQQLKGDKDLDAVRSLPEFEPQLAQWEIHFAEMEKRRAELLVQRAKEELASSTSFPFDFDLTDVDGKPLKLAELQGRVCVVDFWGTWCPPCRQEVPSFIKLQDKYGKFGFQMIGLNQERGPSDEANIRTVQEFIKNNSMNYPCALVPDTVAGQVPDLRALPTTLFIDHHGKVRLKSVGFHEYEYMMVIVETLLKEQATEARGANTN